LEKITTLKDIAKKLDVSITTISKALNNHPDISAERRKQILELASEMQYFPNTIASNLRKGRTRFIAIIISDNTNPYYARLIKGAEEEIAFHNYHTIIFNTNEDPAREMAFIKDLLSIKVAGVIITPAKGNPESARILKDFKIPYVLANRYLKKNEDNYVIADDVMAGYMATDYLIKKRFKKVILINNFEDITSASDRGIGYKNALKDNNLSFLKNQVYSGIINNTEGYNITKNKVLMDHRPPFSILCYSDYIASGVIKCLSEAGLKIPDEVAVMGIDNIELFSFSHPGLTTISIPKFLIGKECVKMLFNLMENPGYSYNRIILELKLIIRESA
jgi:DNA-binding LacI/PurR family transcriptional regulator